MYTSDPLACLVGWLVGCTVHINLLLIEKAWIGGLIETKKRKEKGREGKGREGKGREETSTRTDAKSWQYVRSTLWRI